MGRHTPSGCKCGVRHTPLEGRDDSGHEPLLGLHREVPVVRLELGLREGVGLLMPAEHHTVRVRYLGASKAIWGLHTDAVDLRATGLWMGVGDDPAHPLKSPQVPIHGLSGETCDGCQQTLSGLGGDDALG